MARRNNGEGTIRHNKERKRWEARVTVDMVDGKQVRKMITAKTKDELLDRLKETRSALDVGLPAPDRRETVAQFLTTWVEHLPYTDRTTATAKNYADMVSIYILPKLGTRLKLTDLAPRHIEKMQRDILADGKSARTARLSRSVLRAALTHAEKHGLVARNAAALADPVKAEKRKKQSMTVEQALKLIAAVRGDRDEAAVVTLLTLGLRRGELLALQWVDVTFPDDKRDDGGVVHIWQQLQRGENGGLAFSDTKTVGSVRTQAMPPKTVQVLRAHKVRQAKERLAAGEHWNDHDLIFANRWGGPIDPDNFRNRFTALCEKAGIGHWSPHGARHTAGSLMFDNGADLKVVSEALGHSSIRVTADIYIDMQRGRAEESADAMTRALTPKKKSKKTG